MSMLHSIKGWIQEPPPAYVFEISEAGLAWAKTAPFQTGFAPFHRPAVEVKGATFTELAVRQQTDGSWIAQCVVDV